MDFKNCCETNCTLISDDNEQEVLLNQIKREVKKLMEDTTARLLCQDKKINETCVYIKNNLSNSIRELIDNMSFTGELDEIIQSVVLDSIFPVGNVKRYGAIGDGVTDDTTAINLACEDARNNNTSLIIDSGKYKVTKDIDARYIENIVAYGDVRCSGNAQFIVGCNSTSTPGAYISLRRVDNIKVIGLRTSKLYFKYCENLNIYANGDSETDYATGYNLFEGGYCRNINLFSEGNADGWINENTFVIRKVLNITIDGNYDHNNNHFEHCNLENGTLNLLNARNNTFSFRGEGGVTINSTNKSSCNLLEKEYYFEEDFGDVVEEKENGTYIYHPINKLQIEKELYSIDSQKREIPVGSIVFNENGTLSGVSYKEIYHSGYIEIKNTFALKFKTTSKVLRAKVNFYDENYNLITEEVDNIINNVMRYDATNHNYYITVNNDENVTIIKPGKAKYCDYIVYFGNSVESYTLRYIDIKLIKFANTDLHIINETKYNQTNSIPTKGYWLVGQKLDRANPVAGDYASMICLESGAPGVWKNVSKIME